MSERARNVDGTFWDDANDSESHQRCRTLLNAIDDGIVVVDADGGPTFANERATDILDCSRDELSRLGVGTSHWTFFDESGEPLEQAEIPFNRVVDREKPVSEQTLGVRGSSGERVWLSVNGAPQWDQNDEFDGAVFVFEDVTDQRDVESELEEILGRVTDAFYALDEEFRFTHVNERAEELIDFEGEGLVGRHIWEAFEWAGDSVIREEYERAMETQNPTSFEVYYPEPLDTWFEIHVYPSTTGLSVYFRDVTDRKERESERAELLRELRESEQRLQLALEASEMGTWELDLQTRESPARSPRHDRIFGYEEPLEGWDFEAFLDHVHPDDRERVKRRFEEAFETGTWQFECRILRADGEERVIAARGEFTVDSEGEPVRAAGTVQDVTERAEREQALEESERRYRTLAEYFPNGLVTLFDHDLEYTLAAGLGFDRIPVEPDSLEGRQFHDVWPDETAAELEPAFQAALEGEEASIELEYAGREWVLHAVPITDDEGDVFAGMTMAQDITEQKEREQYLENAKAQLEAATEAGAVGTWEWHVPEDKLIVSGSLANAFDVDADDDRREMPLERFLSSIHEEDRDRVAAQIEDAVEHCGEYEAEYRVRDDDELRWVVARGHVKCDETGTAQRFPGVMTDITERKRAELEAEKQSRELETLFQVLPVGAVVANEDGSLLRANDTAREIWGSDAFDVASIEEYDKFSAVWADSGEPVEREDWTMYQVLQGEEVQEPNIYEISTFDDRQRIIMEHGKPVRDVRGDVHRAVVTLTDITERRAYRRKLEESNERLEQFAYAASHDLQEPLRMVTSYLQLIENRYADALDDDGEEFIEFAVDGATRMQKMIDGLLEYARVDTRGNPFEPVELNAILEDVLEDLRVQIDEADAEIRADDLPRVDGDASQLRQVFQNLLQNAIEYSGDEPPRVEIAAERTGDRWTVSIRDEGIGIDPDETERIFEVFQRLQSTEESEGTGIGLALCQRIVERHGGDIWVDSEPGEGATVSFTLSADA
ncbi:PAS domain S-box protein [Natrarchaeobius halalkaliphilus]|uniref:histidine kinase n=1 Tax=Natrarchaeobius halalkaliphilus TaxID=1679091 RepID=A0A3N6MCP1_9EURY|nr:PAS domain-containing protein [Natrarchaeobius halalkaliphilus]RQG93271.1 PAS domain S-box protein [Natrarchaeobius halalkaliphilus]